MLESICTDLETSKRLKELGFDAKTKFYWENDYINDNISIGCWFNKPSSLKEDYEYTKAYTLEQVLSKLPKSVKHSFTNYTLNFDYTEECIEYKWISDEPYTEDKILIYQLRDITENWATTAAKLWIQLKESEIV